MNRAAGMSADTSILLELIAIALRSGAPLSHAIEVVADAAGPPQRETLRPVGQALALGLPVEVAFRGSPTRWRDLEQVAALAERSGADLAALLDAAAADLRVARRRAAETESARLGVALVLPTGLCILPAFVVLGIVPTVASLLGRIALGT